MSSIAFSFVFISEIRFPILIRIGFRIDEFRIDEIRVESPGDEIRIRIANSYTNSPIRIQISSPGNEFRIRNFVSGAISYGRFSSQNQFVYTEFVSR